MLSTVSRADQDHAGGPRITLAIVALTGLVLLLASVAMRDALAWYGRPFPGVLVDPGGSVSSLGLPVV